MFWALLHVQTSFVGVFNIFRTHYTNTIKTRHILVSEFRYIRTHTHPIFFIYKCKIDLNKYILGNLAKRVRSRNVGLRKRCISGLVLMLFEGSESILMWLKLQTRFRCTWKRWTATFSKRWKFEKFMIGVEQNIVFTKRIWYPGNARSADLQALLTIYIVSTR